MCEPKLIKIDFNLSSNKDNLDKADLMISNLKKEISYLNRNTGITNDIHEKLYEETILVLDWVGRMSMNLFEIRDKLDEQYKKIYCRSPKLALEEFDKHYKKLHQPYNILKNRCFGILEELDFMYERKFNKKPRNWNTN